MSSEGKKRSFSGVKKPASGRRGAPRNADGSFKSKAEDADRKNVTGLPKGKTQRPSDKTIASKPFLPAALFNSTGIDLNHPIEGQQGKAVETYGDVIMRAAAKGRAYDLDPLFDVVTREAVFLRSLVESMMAEDLAALTMPEKGRCVEQITRSLDTILRGIEFAQGRADSRPDILLKQATMEMLSDEELAKMEQLYVTAHTRTTRITTTRKETYVEHEMGRKEDRSVEPQAADRLPVLAHEAELADVDDPFSSALDFDEPRAGAGGYRSDYDSGGPTESET